MSQQMIVGVRLNPKTVPQEVIARVVSDEVRKAEARTRKQVEMEYSAVLERARTIEETRNEMLGKLNAAIARRVYRRKTPIGRIFEKIGTAWGIIAGMAMSWREVGEGLWRFVCDDGER